MKSLFHLPGTLVKRQTLTNGLRLSIPLLTCLFVSNSQLFAQRNYRGFYGKKGFIAIQISLFPPYSNYHRLDDRYQVDITRLSVKSKLGASLGFMTGSRSQISLGVSFHKPADISLKNFNEYNGYMTNVTIRDTASATISSMNYQFFMEFQRYIFLAPVGFNTTVGIGISLTPYSYQYSTVHHTSDYMANTYTRSEEIYAPKYMKAMTPFMSLKIGRSFVLNRVTVIDAGIKSTVFLQKYKDYNLAEHMSNEYVSFAFNHLRKKDFEVNHLIEFYAAYSLHF